MRVYVSGERRKSPDRLDGLPVALTFESANMLECTRILAAYSKGMQAMGGHELSIHEIRSTPKRNTSYEELF